MTRRTFSFVDRITQLEPGARARGKYRVAESSAGLPPSLVAEAIGQLAAWVAMDRLHYRVRPVAGIAAEARFLRKARAGDVLDLEVEIENCSDSDVAYSGCARIDGEPAVELQHCLGPMLPMATFDDPEAVRQRFVCLRGAGASDNEFAGIVEPRLVPGEHRPGQSIEVELQVPEVADFFADHFPRRPVFPATLLLHAEIGIACRLAAEAARWSRETPPQALRVLDVKMRSFISPGERLDVRVDMRPSAAHAGMAKLTTRSEGRRVATARVEIGLQEG